MPRAFLGLGGNLGDRLGLLAAAVRRIHRPPRCEVLASSSVFESKPVGVTAQPDFLNIVIQIATTELPSELLARCLGIEAELGRVRLERWGPRTVDIDILLYDDCVLSESDLTIPHPRMGERSFVMTPLSEIAPTVVLGGEEVSARAARLDRTGLRRIGSLEWSQ